MATPLMQLAQRYFDQSQHAEVQALLAPAVSRTGPERMILARSYLKSGQFSEAITELAEATRQMPTSWEPDYYSGCAYGLLGDYARAEQHFSRVITLKPSMGQAYLQRGHARLKRGELDGARQDYTAAAGFGAAATHGYECLGLLYGKQERHEQAIQVLELAIQAGVDSDAVLWQLGWSSYCLGRFPACVQWWSALLRRHPHHTRMDAYLRKAKSLLDLRYTDHGRYERAVTMEEQAQRLNPMDGAATHALLIVSLREVVQAEATEEQAEIGQVWQRVIRNTALLLHNETFWEEWRTRCEKRYEMLIDQHAIAEVRHRLEQSLLDCLPLPSTLGVALRREFTAAQVLAQAGGFPCSGMDGHRLVCGPQMLRHLGFERQFGRFARAVADQQTQQTPGMQHFKRLFSRLGEAQVLLEHGFPQEALGALQRACCKTCASDSHQCNLEAKWLPHVCQAHCSDFALGNPAYAAWEDRRDRLWQDAVALASEACVALANAQMTVTPMQFESIVMHWQDALRFARTAGTVETTQEKLVDGILGRAANLTEHEQLDDAIALLDQAHSLFQEPFRGQLQGRLAALLSERGVAAASRPNPDWDASFRDIRRSIEINPHVPRRVSRFARALRRRAVEVYEEDRHTAARLLLEALRVLGTGLERFPQEEENLEAQVIKLEGDMEALGFLLYEDGVTQAGSGEYEGGLEDLWLAYELAPHVPQIQQNICRVSEEYVHEARQRGHAIEAAEVLDRALYHFPYDQRLRALRSQVL